MAVSIVTYTGDGSTTQYVITFEYISRDDVVVQVNDVDASFTFINDTTVELTSAPSSGDRINIKRETTSTALVDFADGSTLFESDLDLSAKQSRYLAEEARDRADEAIAVINNNIDDVNTVADISTDVTTVAGQISPTNNIQTLAEIQDGTTATNAITTAASISSAISNVSSISSAVSTVSSDSADVQTLAGISADIQTLADIEDGTTATDAISNVAAIATSVSTVSGIATDVTNVAGKVTEIGRLGTADAVADLAILGTTDAVADMNTLAAISTDIQTVAGKASFITADFVSDLNTLATLDIVADLNQLATSDIVADINLLAQTDVIADLNTLATTDIVSDLNTLATTDIVADLNQLATSDFVSDLNTMATTTNVTNLATVAADIANINALAPNITGVNSFAERYRVGTSDPTTDLDAGDLFFNTTSNAYKFYDGSGWQVVNVSGIGSVLDDTTPQLGGDLDLNSSNITGTGNVSITGTLSADTVNADNLGEHTITAVASGALANGDVVSLNSDGTVSTSGPSIISQTADPETILASLNNARAQWIDDTRFVYGYQKQSSSYVNNGLYVVVGTVNGTTITFGTPTQVTTYTSSNFYLAFWEANNQKLVIAYNHSISGTYMSYRLATVSGTTITLTGSAVVTPTNFVSLTGMDYDVGNDQMLFFGLGASTNFYPTVLPVDISGSSPVLGTPVVVASVKSYGRFGVYDTTNQKVVFLYDQDNNSGRVKVSVGDFSGTPTFGTGVDAFGTTANSDEFYITHDPNSGKVIMVSAYSGGTSILANVGTVSGTTITLGHASGLSIFTASGTANSWGVHVSSQDNKVNFICSDTNTSNEIYYVQAEISGNTLANVSSPNAISVNNAAYLIVNTRIGFDMNPNTNKLLFSERADIGTSYEHTVYVEQLPYDSTNVDQYIGISSAAYADGDTAKIQILGSIDDAQTGLTAGSTYYLADDGTLSTTNNGRKVGKATSATEILIDTAMSGPEMNAYLGGLV